MQDAAAGEASESSRPPSSRTLRNTATVLAARVASRLIALFTVLAMGNHLGPYRLGEFQTLVNWTAVVTVLIDLGFNTLYVREGARNPGELSRYLSNLGTTRLLMAPLAMAALAGALLSSHLERLLLPGFVLMLLASYSSLLRGTFYALQRLNWEVVSIVLEALVLLALTLTGIALRQGVAWFLWSYAASYAFSCLFIGAVLVAKRMARPRPRFEWPLVRRFFWAGLPFALTFVITTIYFKIDVPILQLLKGNTEVGWYAFAYKPFEALLFVPITMLNVIFPILSVYHRQRPDRVRWGVDRFYKSLALVGLPISLGVVILAPGFTRLFHLFPQSEPALAILGTGIFGMFVNNAFIAALNSIDRQAQFTSAAAASMVVNVTLNLALIPAYGYLGSAWATVATEYFLLAAGWYLTARHSHRVPLVALSWRILAAGAVMATVLWPMREWRGAAVLLAVVIGAAAYAAAGWLLRVLDQEELGLLKTALGRGAA